MLCLAGMFTEALEQLEYCYELTDENEIWFVRDKEGEVTVHHDACVHLHRIYTKLAIMALEEGDRDTSVDYYLKAYNAAREGRPVDQHFSIISDLLSKFVLLWITPLPFL